MQNKYYPLPLVALLGAVATGAGHANAQSGEGTRVTQLEEVIVTAQRRGENIQDVPMTVTAISGEQVKELNLFRFEDIQQLSPGLSLQSEGAFGSVAQLRGVGFDSNASASPAVDIYINESPVDANYAFQSIYDIGQIEVLRGPQGTLRGRPSPGGAITLTTRRPELTGWGGTLYASAGDRDTVNTEAALNIPLVENRLAARIAAVYNEADADQVRSVHTGRRSERETDSWRLSLRWAPTDSLDATLTHQSLESDRVALVQVQGPGAGYNGPPISGRGLSVNESFNGGTQESELTTLAVAWELPGHRVIYNASLQDNSFRNRQELDAANAVTDYVQLQITESSYEQQTHELRLESAGENSRVDYVLGLWHQDTDTSSSFSQETPLDGAFGNPMMPSPFGPPDSDYLLPVVGEIPTDITNKAIFGNLTFNIAERTQLSVGARYLEDSSRRSQTLNLGSALTAVGIAPGLPVSAVVPGGCNTLVLFEPTFTGNEPFTGYCDLRLAASNFDEPASEKHSEWVYTGSLRHHFSDDVMTYFTYGRSWRPAGVTVGVTSPVSPDLLQGEPEESDSYELGLRSTWLDGHLRINASLFHQDFDNFIGRFNEVPYLGAGGTVQEGGFTYPGDAKVNGGELEMAWDFTDNWWAQLTYARADGRFDDARVPCKDTNLDGRPDDGDSGQLTPEDFGGQSVIYCQVNSRISTAPERSATLQSEYTFPLLSHQGYLRALYTYQSGETERSLTFKRDGFGILNLYAGLRSRDGSWELGLWARNLLDEEEKLTQGQPGTSYGVFPTGYAEVSYTPEREIGATLRYVFGEG